MMNHEYIVPMSDQTREITLYPTSTKCLNGGNCQTLEVIPSTSLSTSLKPQLHFSSPCFVLSGGVEGECAGEMAFTDSPEIPLDTLKNLTMEMLISGVWAVDQGVRDPVGGSIELLLVPLIRLFCSLLAMGVFEDEDLGKVLRLIEPEVFSKRAKGLEETWGKDASNDDEGGNKKENDTPKKGLLQMKLPEAVKLQVKK